MYCMAACGSPPQTPPSLETAPQNSQICSVFHQILHMFSRAFLLISKVLQNFMPGFPSLISPSHPCLLLLPVLHFPIFTLLQLPGLTFLSKCKKLSPAPLRTIWTSTCSPDSNHMPLDLFWSVRRCFVPFGQDPASAEIKEKIPIDSMALVPKPQIGNSMGCFPCVLITAAHRAHLGFWMLAVIIT